ncbi:COMM domain-containing protein 6 isoform X1 [Phascolarctos cinereus]
MATGCQSSPELTMEGLCQPQEAKSEVTNQVSSLWPRPLRPSPSWPRLLSSLSPPLSHPPHWESGSSCVGPRSPLPSVAHPPSSLTLLFLACNTLVSRLRAFAQAVTHTLPVTSSLASSKP